MIDKIKHGFYIMKILNWLHLESSHFLFLMMARMMVIVINTMLVVARKVVVMLTEVEIVVI